MFLLMDRYLEILGGNSCIFLIEYNKFSNSSKGYRKQEFTDFCRTTGMLVYIMSKTAGSFSLIVSFTRITHRRLLKRAVVCAFLIGDFAFTTIFAVSLPL